MPTDLWSFALACYAQPGVEQTCLRLQDDAYWDGHANPKAKRDQKREEQVCFRCRCLAITIG